MSVYQIVLSYCKSVVNYYSIKTQQEDNRRQEKKTRYFKKITY